MTTAAGIFASSSDSGALCSDSGDIEPLALLFGQMRVKEHVLGHRGHAGQQHQEPSSMVSAEVTSKRNAIIAGS